MDNFYRGGDVMVRKLNKIIERPAGIGELKKENENIATVEYSMKVMREIIITEEAEIEGFIQLNGKIRFINEYKPVEPDEIYTLRLKDGRQIDISLPLVNFPGKDFEFIVRNRTGFEPKAQGDV